MKNQKPLKLLPASLMIATFALVLTLIVALVSETDPECRGATPRRIMHINKIVEGNLPSFESTTGRTL
jgi:hypothetical protein